MYALYACVPIDRSSPLTPIHYTKYNENFPQAQNPDIISDVRGWGLINGVELSQASGLQAAKVVQVRERRK
jgi:acetylornithine/succinyldiaminopimelate/putrescine aminotransferase